jgi:outer membrane protein assembly factor BamB
MGRVYLAQSRSGRPVAVKVIRADLVDDPATRRRFAREVATARTISPLFTAPVVDADTDADPPWLATTYIDGPSLEQWVDEHGPLSPKAVFTLAAGLAEALTSIHAAGLVHRDLKPSNVLLSDTGPHVIDFGVVLTPHATRVSMGLAVGTPSYMAPEVIHGAEAGPPADIFALGATLVVAATGSSLVESETVYAQIMQITQGRFKLSAVPLELRPLIVRCLSLEPEHRPSAAELTGILVAGGVPAPEPGWYKAAAQPAEPSIVLDLPTRSPRITRRRVLAGAGAAGLATIGGVGLWLATRASGESGGAAPSQPKPGTVLWQTRSGAQPTAGGPLANRIIPDPARRVVAAKVSEVFALTTEGRRLWTHSLPERFVDAHAWEGGVLVADLAALWLLDTASGRQRFALDAAALAKVGSGDTARDRAQSQVQRLVCSADRAFVRFKAATVALDAGGRTLWRNPAAGQQPATANPHAADATRLVTHARTGSTVEVALHDAATGQRQWNTRYTVPNRPPEGPPPEGPHRPPPDGPPPDGRPPDGGPPDGGPPDKGHPDGGPRPFDDAWQRSEGLLGAGFVALRDGQEIRVLRLSNGRTVWQRSWPKPVATITSVGDLLLVGADRLNALDIASGTPAWQAPLSGARVAISADQRTIIAATGSTISALDLGGNARWQADVPDSVTRAAPDRLTIDRNVAFVTFKPAGERLLPLDIDVIAVALGG